jgi:imidazolonepropionase-like amidohydrolase
MYEAGFRHIKLSPYYTAEEVAAAVDEAKTRRMRITSHGGGYSDTSPATMARIAVMAGIQSIEHANEMPDEVLDLMARRGVQLIPTLAILRTLYQAPSLIPTMKELIEDRGWSVEMHEKIFKKARERGIVMGMGTDAVGTLLDQKYPGMYFEEMEYFVQLGMSRLEAISAATRNGAIILGRERDLGTLEPGKLADLQVVDGDPLVSYAPLGKPSLVMVGGKVLRPR